MSIRCAVCGSKRVVDEVKKEGFNHKKGAIGVAFMGKIGALMGVNGNDVKYYHCADCSQTLNHIMSDSESKAIDFAINHKENVSFLAELQNYKEKYKNIEFTDEDEKKLIRIKNSQTLFCDKYVVNELVEYLKEKGKKTHEEIKTYLDSLGYLSKVIDTIPNEIAYNIDGDYHNILFSVDNKHFSYEYTTKRIIDGKTLEEYNMELYESFFEDKIKKEKDAFRLEEQKRKNIEKAIIELYKNDIEKFSINDLQECDIDNHRLEKSNIQEVLSKFLNANFISAKKINEETFYYWKDTNSFETYIQKKNKINELLKMQKNKLENEKNNYSDKLEKITKATNLETLDINTIKSLYNSSRFKTMDKCYVIDFIFVVALIFLANNEDVNIWKEVIQSYYDYFKENKNTDEILIVLKEYPNQIKKINENMVKTITSDYTEDYKKIKEFINWKIK